ncbi:type II secretion system secretin GspD [Rubellimicrobium aerolatum]|uniref:Type II secretion system secretin GspD n=1 Tax=Rubellimicrobium aerolatum TaxID=490979 RepID=A0ABW0SCH2_9RHOB|nr:type II secretion system secretin GspD [Rubellimicrobium aerolatum]MBP1806176.1 general secretion pathway protein D [Rubellimicrobium aerolatum]
MIRLLVLLAAGLLLALSPVLARAQEPGTFVINLRGADISVLAAQVSEITGRTLVLAPEVTGEVTVVSSERLDEAGVWALFQSILRSRGFVAVETDTVWQVVPEAEARTIGGANPTGAAGTQDVVTEILRLSRLPSAEAVRVLRPLVAESGYIEALVDPNAILLTDTRANVERILEIARAFDAETDEQSEVIRFANADAATVGNAILGVLGPAGTSARLSVDPSSNLLLVRGTQEEVDEIRDLARSMDVPPLRPPQEAVTTTVFRLQYGDAAIVAEIIQGTLGQGTDIVGAAGSGFGLGLGTNPGTAEPLVAAAGAGAGAGEAEVAEGGSIPAVEQVAGGSFVPLNRAADPAAVTVQASIETNSIIVRGTAAQVQEVGNLVRALDVRRPQVMIEAAIVEVSGDVAERLGIQLGFAEAAQPGGVAATSFSNGGVSIQNVLTAIGAPAEVALSTGLTVGASNDDFGILVQALSQSSQARLLSTPSVTTLDNEPATIVVGQNVPFRTGSFATDGNTVTPFTTIERRDVGITMNVVPRITAGGVVQLEIEQEVSSLVNANVEGAADLITNRRVINTTVLADNRGTVVLGGLITDDQTSQDQKVPGLGDVPVLGNLFRSRNDNQTNRTLFVFLRPTILRDQNDIRQAAEDRYTRLRAADATEPPRTILGEREVRSLPLEIQGLY